MAFADKGVQLKPQRLLLLGIHRLVNLGYTLVLQGEGVNVLFEYVPVFHFVALFFCKLVGRSSITKAVEPLEILRAIKLVRQGGTAPSDRSASRYRLLAFPPNHIAGSLLETSALKAVNLAAEGKFPP